MPRELSKAEKAYIIANHNELTAEVICEDMPGVGKKTIEQFIETSVMPNATREETAEEYHKQVRKRTGKTAGELMARDPKRGIAAMTEAASSFADAKCSTKNTPLQNNRVHVMDPKKRVR